MGHIQRTVQEALLVRQLVCCRAKLADGTRIHCYFMPWECLDKAEALYKQGAQSVCLFPGTPGGYFHWSRGRYESEVAA